MGRAPGKQAIASSFAYPKLCFVLRMNNFPICCPPLVNFSCPEMVAFGNSLQFYTHFCREDSDHFISSLLKFLCMGLSSDKLNYSPLSICLQLGA